jgi:hypothetical protein
MYEHINKEIRITANQADAIAEILGVDPDLVCKISITPGLAEITQVKGKDAVAISDPVKDAEALRRLIAISERSETGYIARIV